MEYIFPIFGLEKLIRPLANVYFACVSSSPIGMISFPLIFESVMSARRLIGMGTVVYAMFLCSLFWTNERAFGHHMPDAGPHCSYGIDFYLPSNPDQRFRVAEYGILTSMNPGFTMDNPGHSLEAYARIDKFAQKCVLEENFLRGFSGAARLVAGDQRGLSDCEGDINRQAGIAPNRMGIYNPKIFDEVVEMGVDYRTDAESPNNPVKAVEWFASRTRAGSKKPNVMMLEALDRYCRTAPDYTVLVINQVAMHDWLGRQTTCIDMSSLSGAISRVYTVTCGQVREMLSSTRVSSIRDIMPKRQLPSNAPDFGISLEENVDRPGMDYGRIFLNSNDGPDACKWLCENDNKCRSFTFVRRGFQGSRPICYVKSGVPNKVSPRPCCVSGKKFIALNDQNQTSGGSTAQPRKKAEDRVPKILNQRPNITSRQLPKAAQNQRMTLEQNSDRPGSDYSKITMSGNARPTMCSGMCEKDRRCKAFTFVKKGYQGNTAVCYLKDKSPKLVKNKSCCVSGVKR